MSMKKNLLGIMLFSGLAQTATATHNDQSPQVLDHYPNCDYTVLDTLKFTDRRKREANLVTREMRQDMLDEIVGKIKTKAQELNADGIILLSRTEQDIDRFSPRMRGSASHIMRVKAQFIGNCDLSEGLSDNKTPKSALIPRAYSVDMRTFNSLKFNITLTPPKPPTLNRPALASHAIDEFGTVYGMTLGSLIDDALDAWGDPALHLKLSDHHQLLVFGREFYALFEDNQLVEATNENRWLSAELRNLLPVDERFEHKRLQILGQANMALSLNEAKSTLTGFKAVRQGELAHASAAFDVTLKFDTARHINANLHHPLRFFAIRHQDASDVAPVPYIADRATYQKLSAMITQGLEDHSPLIKTLSAAAWGAGRLNRTTAFLLLDNHLLVEKRGSSIVKLHVLEQAIPLTNDQQPDWRLGEFAYGLSKTEVNRQDIEDMFEMSDELYMSNDVSSQRWTFSDDGDKGKLISGIISVF